ncbi:MAG: hypothetical protein H6828_09525 [Planctomycetes bacterium]|nr:hypothetical protein [Planctomycetota bacterium]
MTLPALGSALAGALVALALSAPRADVGVQLPERSQRARLRRRGPRDGGGRPRGRAGAGARRARAPPRADATTWRAWGAALAGCAGDAEEAPADRAGLALFARAQGRWSDAWAHLEHLGGHPEWSAAVLPLLLPGVPDGTPPGHGGLPSALPDGVLLTPALPPSRWAPSASYVEPTQAEVHGLRIGDATVDVRVSLDGSGVQVDLLHTGGGPATVRVLLPEPEGLAIRVEYLDWMRQDAVREAMLVELLPGEEEHNLFGRFAPRRTPLPASPRGELPRALREGGLWFECGADEALEEVRAAAEVMAAALGVPGGVVAPGEAPGCGPWSPTLVHLAYEPGAARRLLAQVAARLERRLTAGATR